jgi:NADPH:quinone reductase-like Zn-dependent oxidoreductase
MVEPDGDGLEELAALVHGGGLRVLVDGTFPLERAADAHRRGETGGTDGQDRAHGLTHDGHDRGPVSTG